MRYEPTCVPATVKRSSSSYLDTAAINTSHLLLRCWWLGAAQQMQVALSISIQMISV